MARRWHSCVCATLVQVLEFGLVSNGLLTKFIVSHIFQVKIREVFISSDADFFISWYQCTNRLGGTILLFQLSIVHTRLSRKILPHSQLQTACSKHAQPKSVLENVISLMLREGGVGSPHVEHAK
jgi:hypothetical protein